MPKQADLLIVIADGEHARFLQAAETGALHTVTALDSALAHKRSSDIGSDHPGASFHSNASVRHVLPPRHDPHDLAEVDFAHLVASEIDAACARGSFNRLVLVAPTRTLGAIREKLGAAATAAIAGTLAKDLLKIPDHALREHLQPWLEPPGAA